MWCLDENGSAHGDMVLVVVCSNGSVKVTW